MHAHGADYAKIVTNRSSFHFLLPNLLKIHEIHTHTRHLKYYYYYLLLLKTLKSNHQLKQIKKCVHIYSRKPKLKKTIFITHYLYFLLFWLVIYIQTKTVLCWDQFWSLFSRASSARLIQSHTQQQFREGVKTGQWFFLEVEGLLVFLCL